MILTNNEAQTNQIHVGGDDIGITAEEIKIKEDVIIQQIFMSLPTKTWNKNKYKKLIEDTAKTVKKLYCKLQEINIKG